MAVLSIHSSVAFGTVGNAAVVFALQRLGIEVWPVNTVRFSNHPGYGAWQGQITDTAEVAQLVQGIGARGAFARCRAVLSGYLGGAGTAAVVLDAVAAVKAANVDALYCCDPVLGDTAEGLYVAADVAAAIERDLLPAADVILPNAFELCHLGGGAAGTFDQTLDACDALIGRGPRLVVATSLMPGENLTTVAATAGAAWRVTTPALATPTKGAGDLFAALFLGRYLEAADVGEALSAAVSSTFGVIAATEGSELSLVAAQDEIARPSRRFAAERVR